MRLEITRKSDLAVRAIAALAKLGRLKGAQLAEMLGTTPGFEESETCALHDAWLPARAALLERLASTPVVVAVRRAGVPVNRLMEVGS